MSNPSTTHPQPSAMPHHVAVIMDGNGRWAKRRGKPRTLGHRRGAEAATKLIDWAADRGVKVLTLYSFSTENWSRSKEEVAFIMTLAVRYLRSRRRKLMAQGAKIVPIGRREGLPPRVLAELDRVREATAGNTRITVQVAINYGGRQELTDAARALAADVAAGRLSPAAVDEQVIADRLYTAGTPDPDLLIRTAGEMRVSNFLLWQISYAELYVTDTCWPDFDEGELDRALASYTSRQRRYGGGGDTPGLESGNRPRHVPATAEHEPAPG